MDLKGKVAVVTGASSGIGEAGARALAAAGLQVVAVARRRQRLEALAAELPSIHAYAADVTSDADVANLAGWVEARFGACHVLVNNAGSGHARRFRGPADVADVTALLDLNFLGAVRCMGAFAELLFASAPARVINVGSVAGKIAVGAPAYSASKFALAGFTEALSADWADRGVAVSQLNPGFVRTEGHPQTELMASPLRRVVATPQLVAAALVEVARSGAFERTVPRWYRPLVVLRHVAPPLYRTVAARVSR